jgi:hypothetical protein
MVNQQIKKKLKVVPYISLFFWNVYTWVVESENFQFFNNDLQLPVIGVLKVFTTQQVE